MLIEVRVLIEGPLRVVPSPVAKTECSTPGHVTRLIEQSIVQSPAGDVELILQLVIRARKQPGPPLLQAEP